MYQAKPLRKFALNCSVLSGALHCGVFTIWVPLLRDYLSWLLYFHKAEISNVFIHFGWYDKHQKFRVLEIWRSHNQSKWFICSGDGLYFFFLAVHNFEYFNLFVFSFWCSSWEGSHNLHRGKWLRVGLYKSVWTFSSPSHRKQCLPLQLILVIQVKCNLNLDLLTLWLCKMMLSSQLMFFPIFSLFLVIRCSLERGKLFPEASFACAFVKYQGNNLRNQKEGNMSKSHYSWVYPWKGGGHLKNIKWRFLVMIFWITLIFCFLASALLVLTLFHLLFHSLKLSSCFCFSPHHCWLSFLLFLFHFPYSTFVFFNCLWRF